MQTSLQIVQKMPCVCQIFPRSVLLELDGRPTLGCNSGGLALVLAAGNVLAVILGEGPSLLIKDGPSG